MHRSAMYSLAAGAALAALAANTDKGHAHPLILEHDTFLFSDEAPAGRLFEAGSAHPGEAWADEPAVALDGADILLGAGGVNGEPGLSVAEQIAAAVDEQATKFDEAWAELNAAKGRTDEENADLRGQIASLTEDLRLANGEKDRLEGQSADLSEKLAGAQAELEKANAKIAEQAAAIAKFDPDGDGKPGGSAPKTAK